VTEFKSGEEVLQYARLQIAPLGDSASVLVVEGSDDRKLFSLLCVSPAQVIVAGGKDLVLAAHGALRSEDVDRLVFLVDCDGDVGRGTLRGSMNLIITEHADVEGDLIALGALESVVMQLVPAVASGERDAASVAATVQASVCRLAEPVGRVRRAARLASIPLKTVRQQDMEYTEIGKKTREDLALAEALRQVARAAGLSPYQTKRIAERLGQTPRGFDVCNGHDLVEAVREVLVSEYTVPGGRAAVRSADVPLRMAMQDAARREVWSVIARLRRWEAHSGSELLKP
jgi:hypothetical protein